MEKRTSSDNRLYCRYPYHAPLKFAGIGSAGSCDIGPLAPCSAIDVSEGGIAIQLSGRHLKKGAMIVIRLPVPNLKVSVPVLSEVRWVNEVTPGRLHVGLRFIS